MRETTDSGRALFVLEAASYACYSLCIHRMLSNDAENTIAKPQLPISRTLHRIPVNCKAMSTSWSLDSSVATFEDVSLCTATGLVLLILRNARDLNDGTLSWSVGTASS